VSGTLARTSADGSQDGAPAPRPGRLAAWLTPVNIAIIVITAVALALRLYYQYTRPGFLVGVTEYDDGPYFGSAVRLVHGSLDYRNFVLVQPPGITLLMSPVGVLTYWTGTAWGLAIGRILTVLAGTAAVALAGLLVRHRGLLAVVVTCGIMAVYADAVAAAHTVLVEPWLVLFCLIGAVVVFDGDRLTDSSRRMLWGGAAFGFAGAVEGWAIVPVLIITALCLPKIRQALRFVAGVAAGFLIPSLPFIIASPSQFYRSVITAQVGYRAHTVRVGVLLRLKNIIGLPYTLGWARTTVLLAVLAVVIYVLVTQAGAVLITKKPQPILDWFATVSTVLVVAMFLWPPQFHYHFAAFLAPFLAMTLALPLARMLADVAPGTIGPALLRQLTWAAVGLAGLALAIVAVFQAKFESGAPSVIGPIPARIDQIIPPGACVLTDQVSVTLAADRFESDVPGCSQMVDSLGTDLALGDGRRPQSGAGRVPAVSQAWHQAFSTAGWVLLTPKSNLRIPWNPALLAYFHSHFRLARHMNTYNLYVRDGIR
jgi:hypothetical protein